MNSWLDFLFLSQEQRNQKQIMAALDNLNSNIVNLTKSVDAALAKLTEPKTGVPEEAVQAAADAVSTQSARLDAGVNPPAPVP